MQVSGDDHAYQKNVRVGIRQGDAVQVIDGLQAGDRVVASGAYGLPDKSKIKVESQNEK
jgi:multidrug efflux pump subunit AcrA (membrane-fusion protein)